VKASMEKKFTEYIQSLGFQTDWFELEYWVSDIFLVYFNYEVLFFDFYFPSFIQRIQSFRNQIYIWR
jgi:hypothetical protein